MPCPLLLHLALLFAHLLLWTSASVALQHGDASHSSFSVVHITDVHIDSEYAIGGDPRVAGAACHAVSSGGAPPLFPASEFGAYRCDAPISLVRAAGDLISAISPSFVVWTGDNTPHDDWTHETRALILRNVFNATKVFRESIPPTIPVFPVVGNHDFYPNDEAPSGPAAWYQALAHLWKQWLSPSALDEFALHGYYSDALVVSDGGAVARIVALNTVLWYAANSVSAASDPGGQWAWLELVLRGAEDRGEAVFLIGHVGPGVNENDGEVQLAPHHNARYVSVVSAFHSVIRGQFFGHLHSDSFRVLANTTVSFNAPSLTPWKNPWGVSAPNNPAVRVYECSEDLTVLDYTQLWTPLQQANRQHSLVWYEEYRARATYHMSSLSSAAWSEVVRQLALDVDQFDVYYKFNRVSFPRRLCRGECRVRQLCALQEVTQDAFESCLNSTQPRGP